MSKLAKQAAFLGIGWGFPPSFDKFSPQAADAPGVRMVSGEEDIKQAIRLILDITPGDRVMAPKFGCNLRRFAFEPMDTALFAMIETEVRSALLHFEARIDVNRIAAEPLRENARAVIVTIDYTVRTSNRRQNLVYPYYLAEATGLPQ